MPLVLYGKRKGSAFIWKPDNHEFGPQHRMSDIPRNSEGYFLNHPEVDGLWHQVINSLLAESDRGAVLIGTTYVDANLKRLFEVIAPQDLSKRRLEPILKYPGPLSSFAARTHVAFLCRLIHRSLYDAIEALREIRNQVAHEPDTFVLGNHRDKLERILSLGPGLPLWVNRMACELLRGSFLANALEIKLPDSEKPAFETETDVLKYIQGRSDLLAPLNDRLPRCELAIGIVFICALLIKRPRGGASCLRCVSDMGTV